MNQKKCSTLILKTIYNKTSIPWTQGVQLYFSNLGSLSILENMHIYLGRKNFDKKIVNTKTNW